MTCAMCRASRMRVSVQHVCYLQSANASNVKITKNSRTRVTLTDVIRERDFTELRSFDTVNMSYEIIHILILTEPRRCVNSRHDFT